MEHSGLFFGAAYYIDGVTPEQIREDLAAMQAAGMNFVRLQGCCWQSWEPERGCFALKGLEEALALCAFAGLRPQIAVPTLPAPTWLEGGTEAEILGDAQVLLERLFALAGEGDYQVDSRPEGSRALADFQARFLRGRGCSVTAVTPLSSAADPFAPVPGDHMGCGIFHPAGLKNTGASLNFQADMARSARQGCFVVSETQCQGALGQLPFPGQLRLAAFHHIASGAQGLCYWPWHSDCCPGADWQGVIG